MLRISKVCANFGMKTATKKDEFDKDQKAAAIKKLL